MTWIPLHVHSQYSILDSTASVEALARRAKELGLPALALTDRGNLYGAIDFYKACRKEGVRPIVGCELCVAPGKRTEKGRGVPILLLAKNEAGYHNLCKLSSLAFLEGFYFEPRIDKELLAQHAEGLVCVSGSDAEFPFYCEVFGADFYLELQRHPFVEEGDESWLVQKMREYGEEQEKMNARLLALARERCVATNAIHYIARSDWKAHEILLNIQSGEPCEIWERDSQGRAKGKVPNPRRSVMPTRELYFKTPQQMAELFADAPDAVARTLAIAEACQLEIAFDKRHYPLFVPPELEGKSFTPEERVEAAARFLRQLCEEGIARRYTPEALLWVQRKVPERDPMEVVRERFEVEFQILTSKGMSDYVLIVYDFIAWAKRRGIPMGPGRGSAAGSLISYVIGITDIEPLRFHLFFERFINPERISYPDIDVDICMERRQEVIDYVVAKYGKDKVAQIITFGTMKARMAIRDVGRTLNVPLSKVNEIAALVPEDPTMTLEKAFRIDPALKRLMESDEEARCVLEMAQKTEGSIRNTSTHAAGLIISAEPIADLIPVCTAKDSDMVVTQYSMKPVESVGMLKIDFLGLKTLTSIQTCVDEIARRTGQLIDWVNLPLDDRPTFDLLNQGKTLGIFQLESGGMQELAQQLHIDTFEEIIAVCALYRPGPMDMIPSFVNRKHGREPIEIEHPKLKATLEETYGVMVYQEQVMQIASLLAGYTLGEGDVLRRAMGKKDHAEMARQRQKFLGGAQAQGVDATIAEQIFDKIEKFASYGFNKSHAAAYGYLSYATAYFKANYPREWMAALMTCDAGDTTKLAKFIGEAKAMQIPVLPPDINQAGRAFAATDAGIRFAMSGIKGIGSGVVEAIVEERNRKGSFAHLYDLIQRIDKSRVGKKQIELLIDAGCFDGMAWSRDQMRQSVEEMFDCAQLARKEEDLGILNLFSLIDTTEPPFAHPPLVANPSTPLALFSREKELLGFYLTGHPLDHYKDLLQRLQCGPPAEGLARCAFVVEKVEVKISGKTQRKFAILTVGDGVELFELPVWSDLYEEKLPLIREHQLLYAHLQGEKKEGRLQLSCRYLEDLAAMDEAKIAESERRSSHTPKRRAKEEAPPIILHLDADTTRFTHILALKELLRAHPGPSPFQLQFTRAGQLIGTVAVASQWGIAWSPALEERLRLFDIIYVSQVP